MSKVHTLIEKTGVGFICPGCDHVHRAAGEIRVTRAGGACAGCGEPVQFSEETMQRGISRLVTGAKPINNPALDFARFISGLRSTTEVVAVAVAPACLSGSVEVAAGVNGIALVNTKSGQEWHLSKLDALNLLAALARDVEIPTVAPFAKRIAL